MTDYLDRAKRFHDAIRAVLLQEWDPIGVSGLSGAEDEYDGYVGEVYAMLIRNESTQTVSNHLWWIETAHMGLRGNRAKTEAIAMRLCRLLSEMERV